MWRARLLKRADYHHFQPAAAALDQRVQEQILRNVLEEARRDGRKPAIIWVLTNPQWRSSSIA